MRAKSLLLAFATAGALSLVDCSGNEPRSGAQRADRQGEDRGFILEMVSHQEVVLHIAELASRHGESEAVRAFAAGIVTTETRELSAMRVREKQLGAAAARRDRLALAGTVAVTDIDADETSTGPVTERAFLEKLVRHHRGALALARRELADGQVAGVRGLAQEVLERQQQEIDELRMRLGRIAD